MSDSVPSGNWDALADLLGAAPAPDPAPKSPPNPPSEPAPARAASDPGRAKRQATPSNWDLLAVDLGAAPQVDVPPRASEPTAAPSPSAESPAEAPRRRDEGAPARRSSRPSAWGEPAATPATDAAPEFDRPSDFRAPERAAPPPSWRDEPPRPPEPPRSREPAGESDRPGYLGWDDLPEPGPADADAPRPAPREEEGEGGRSRRRRRRGGRGRDRGRERPAAERGREPSRWDAGPTNEFDDWAEEGGAVTPDLDDEERAEREHRLAEALEFGGPPPRPARRGRPRDEEYRGDVYEDVDEVPLEEVSGERAGRDDEGEERGRRRRRRRRGRRGERREGPGVRERQEGSRHDDDLVDDLVDDRVRDADDDLRREEFGEGVDFDDQPARSARGERHHGRRVPASLREEDDDLRLDDDEELSDAERRAHHRSIPSWQEAVGMLVEANLQSRSRHPQAHPGHSGHSGGGGRGGRGRGGRGRGRSSR